MPGRPSRLAASPLVGAFFAREWVRNHALLRATGFTRPQTVLSVATGQAFGAVVGALLGIPLGMLVFSAQLRGCVRKDLGRACSSGNVAAPVPVVPAVVAATLGVLTAHLLGRASPAGVLTLE